MASEQLTGRQIRRLQESLELWRARAAEKQEEIKYLRVKVRDLTASRDEWKSHAGELQQRLDVLEATQAQAVDLDTPFSFFGG